MKYVLKLRSRKMLFSNLDDLMSHIQAEIMTLKTNDDIYWQVEKVEDMELPLKIQV